MRKGTQGALHCPNADGKISARHHTSGFAYLPGNESSFQCIRDAE
jgi:hypothetical protein